MVRPIHTTERCQIPKSLATFDFGGKQSIAKAQSTAYKHSEILVVGGK